MQITHEEARRLIQVNSDNALKIHQKQLLQSHLVDCMDCQSYADSLRRLESILKPMLRRKWDKGYIPLPIHSVIPKASKSSDNTILATRIAAVGLMVIAFMFSIWQFTGSTGQLPGTVPVSTLPAVPTPSTPLTSTQTKSQSCTDTLYIVQQDDTLEGLAHAFSVSKEEIMAVNHLETEALRADTELVIRTCSSKPTGTVNPAANTFTPLRSPTTSTPSGHPTQ